MPSDNKIEASVNEGSAAPAPKAADKILDVARDLFYREGIRAIGVDEIVKRAGVTKPSLYRTFPSKAAILCGFTRRIDEAVLASPVEVAPDERPRDRIFDLLMRRFDALQPYKRALVKLRRELNPPVRVI